MTHTSASTVVQTRSPRTIAYQHLARLAGCTRGVAAIEFGMIVPIMFALFVGAVEFSQAITVDRRVTQVASSTADLVSRQPTVTDTQVAGYMLIISELLAPYDSTRLKLSLNSVYANPSDPNPTDPTDIKVCWNYSYQGGTVYARNAPYTDLVHKGVLTAGTSVIVAEVTYLYVGPTFRYFIGNSGMTFSEKFYLKPRLSKEVVKDTTLKCIS